MSKSEASFIQNRVVASFVCFILSKIICVHVNAQHKGNKYFLFSKNNPTFILNFDKKMQKADNIAPSVFDVAKLSGVSRGTVDRVIHGRGRVSEITRKKVLKAIDELQYRPNSNASHLATRSDYLFACLIPEFKSGEYWEEMNGGFLAAARSFSAGNIRVHIHHYDQTDVASYLRECRAIMEEAPAGVVMNAVFREETVQFAGELEERGIPYAFVDNKIDSLDYTLYYGVDPDKSGALGAWLLTWRDHPSDVALVRLLRDPARKADPNRPRRHGFTDYLEDALPGCRVREVFISPDDPSATLSTLESFFESYPEIRHVAMTNSRIFLLGDYLRRHPDPQRIVIGFDDLKPNLQCLREGLVDALVTRHIPLQASEALTHFAECVIRRHTPEQRDHFVHMDILTRMNLDNY